MGQLFSRSTPEPPEEAAEPPEEFPEPPKDVQNATTPTADTTTNSSVTSTFDIINDTGNNRQSRSFTSVMRTPSANTSVISPNTFDSITNDRQSRSSTSNMRTPSPNTAVTSPNTFDSVTNDYQTSSNTNRMSQNPFIYTGSIFIESINALIAANVGPRVRCSDISLSGRPKASSKTEANRQISSNNNLGASSSIPDSTAVNDDEDDEDLSSLSLFGRTRPTTSNQQFSTSPTHSTTVHTNLPIPLNERATHRRTWSQRDQQEGERRSTRIAKRQELEDKKKAKEKAARRAEKRIREHPRVDNSFIQKVPRTVDALADAKRAENNAKFDRLFDGLVGKTEKEMDSDDSINSSHDRMSAEERAERDREVKESLEWVRKHTNKDWSTVESFDPKLYRKESSKRKRMEDYKAQSLSKKQVVQKEKKREATLKNIDEELDKDVNISKEDVDNYNYAPPEGIPLITRWKFFRCLGVMKELIPGDIMHRASHLVNHAATIRAVPEKELEQQLRENGIHTKWYRHPGESAEAYLKRKARQIIHQDQISKVFGAKYGFNLTTKESIEAVETYYLSEFETKNNKTSTDLSINIRGLIKASFGSIRMRGTDLPINEDLRYAMFGE